MRKKGELLSENVIGMIMATFAVFALIFLMVGLFGGRYDESDKIAESYFESFKIAIEEADSYGRSNFFILDNGDDELNFYLVYFGDVEIFKKEFFGVTREFLHERIGANDVCVCQLRDDFVTCNYCMDIGGVVYYLDKDGYRSIVQWASREGGRISIVKNGESYDFSEA